MLTEAGYRRHLGALRTRLADAMGRTLTRLRTAGLTPWIEPRGGVFLWARLPDGLDATAIARLALAEGVGLAPGPCSAPRPTRTLLALQRRSEPQPAQFRRARTRHGEPGGAHASMIAIHPPLTTSAATLC